MQSKPYHILVVDDEPTILKTVQAYLVGEGYTVHTALDGPGALKAARAFRPDLVVLDIMLPGVDGLEVLMGIFYSYAHTVLPMTAKSGSYPLNQASLSIVGSMTWLSTNLVAIIWFFA